MPRISDLFSTTGGPLHRQHSFPTVSSFDSILSNPLFFAPVIGTVRTGDMITIVQYEPGPIPPERTQKVLGEISCRVWKIDGNELHTYVLPNTHCNNPEIAAAMEAALAAEPSGDPLTPAMIADAMRADGTLQKRGPGRPRKIDEAHPA